MLVFCLFQRQKRAQLRVSMLYSVFFFFVYKTRFFSNLVKVIGFHDFFSGGGGGGGALFHD